MEQRTLVKKEIGFEELSLPRSQIASSYAFLHVLGVAAGLISNCANAENGAVFRADMTIGKNPPVPQPPIQSPVGTNPRAPVIPSGGGGRVSLSVPESPKVNLNFQMQTSSAQRFKGLSTALPSFSGSVSSGWLESAGPTRNPATVVMPRVAQLSSDKNPTLLELMHSPRTGGLLPENLICRTGEIGLSILDQMNPKEVFSRALREPEMVDPKSIDKMLYNEYCALEALAANLAMSASSAEGQELLRSQRQRYEVRQRAVKEQMLRELKTN